MTDEKFVEVFRYKGFKSVEEAREYLDKTEKEFKERFEHLERMLYFPSFTKSWQWHLPRFPVFILCTGKDKLPLVKD